MTNVDITCVSGYTVGGTVSGLVGSGLTLEICTPPMHLGPFCHYPKQVGANGAFTLDAVYPANYSGLDYVAIAQRPSSPTQNCQISNVAVSIQNANDTAVTVSCAVYSYVTNAADNTLSAYSVDPSTGALAVVGTPIRHGHIPLRNCRCRNRFLYRCRILYVPQAICRLRRQRGQQ